MKKMEIIEYQEQYRQAFINFNTQWIIENFGFLEQEDKDTFDKIDEELSSGAMIYFAIEDGQALATCMAKPMQGDTWEICKLGSDQTKPHKGCGTAVFLAAIEWAKNHGAKKLFILSNSKLKTAIHIYEKYGFQEIKLNDYSYVRGDIAFEKIL